MKITFTGTEAKHEFSNPQVKTTKEPEGEEGVRKARTEFQLAQNLNRARMKKGWTQQNHLVRGKL
jgi:hypothetical protein